MRAKKGRRLLRIADLEKPPPEPEPKHERPPPTPLQLQHVKATLVTGQDDPAYHLAPEVIVLTPEELQGWKPPAPRKDRARYVNPALMAIGIEKYFQSVSFTADTNNPPTIAGLAMACGFVTRQALSIYEKKPGFSAMIQRAKLRVEEFWEARLSGKQSNGATMWLKNNAEQKYSDSVEHVGKNGASLFEDMLGAIHDRRASRGTARAISR